MSGKDSMRDTASVSSRPLKCASCGATDVALRQYERVGYLCTNGDACRSRYAVAHLEESHDACGCEKCHPEAHGFAGDPPISEMLPYD